MPPEKPRRYQRGPHIYPRKLRSGAVVWYAYTPARPKGVSLGTHDPAVAEQRFRAILAGALTESDVGGDPSERTIRQVIAAFTDAPHGYTSRTRQSITNRLAAFGTWAEGKGAVLPSEITPGLLDAWITERSADVSRRTVNRDLRALRRALRWAADARLCARNDAVQSRRDLREPSREKRHVVPDPDEMRRILACAAEQHAGAHKALVVLYATGRRIEELRRLTPFDVRDGVLYVRPEAGPAATAEPGKQYATVSLPIAPEVQAALKAFFAWRTNPRTACSEGWLLRRLHDACKAAGVERCGLHDLRRAFATEAHAAGIPVRVVSRWLGHKDVRTTERYLATYRSDLKVQAPVPGGLACRNVRKAGVRNGHRGSDSRGGQARGAKRK